MLIVRSAHEELRRWLTEVSVQLGTACKSGADMRSGTSRTGERKAARVLWNTALIIYSFGSPVDPKLEYDSRAQFYYAYSSLVLYSFGLENALEVCWRLVGRLISDILTRPARQNGHIVLSAECVRGSHCESSSPLCCL